MRTITEDNIRRVIIEGRHPSQTPAVNQENRVTAGMQLMDAMGVGEKVRRVYQTVRTMRRAPGLRFEDGQMMINRVYGAWMPRKKTVRIPTMPVETTIGRLPYPIAKPDISYSVQPIGQNQPQALVFYMAGVKHFMAMFYVEQKTLIIGRVIENEWAGRVVAFIIEYLIEKGLVDVIPEQVVEERPTQKTYDYLEYRNGKKTTMSTTTPPVKCTVGTDPEFEIVTKEGVISASSTKYNRTHEKVKIGADGAGGPLEMRPKADFRACDIVYNMKGLFQQLEYPVSTIGDYFAIGAHIHVGFEGGFRYNAPPDLRWLLDFFLGRPTLNLSGRARGGYKNLSACREQDWGFEYRVCPAAIFTWPKFALIAMKITKHVTEAYLSGRTIKVSDNATTYNLPEGLGPVTIPQFEDYQNYASLSKGEYDQWVEFITKLYPEYYQTQGYRNNVVHNWVKTKTEETGFRNILIRPRGDGQPARDRVAETIRATARTMSTETREEGQLAVFSDDWNPEVRRYIGERIQRLGRRIHFFGLSSTRGDVTAGYEVDGHQRIDDQFPQRSFNGMTFGVPYARRMMLDDATRSHVERIVQIITTTTEREGR